MKKRIFLSIAAIAAIAVGVVGMSAFEAHVINVTAKIENALSVTPDELIFGTVFPQEELTKNLNIALSGSFREEGRVDDVSYIIKAKPKVKPLPGTDVHDPYAIIYPDGYSNGIVAHKYCLENEPIDAGDPQDPYYMYCYPYLCDRLHLVADNSPANDNNPEGELRKSDDDFDDNWAVNLIVPGFTGMIDQAYTVEHYGPTLDPRMEHQVFGCDLWVEVNGISLSETPRPEKRHVSLENKTDNWEVISDDQTWGDIDYSHNDTTFHGTITGTGLVPDSKYQITLNGPGGCTFTDDGLAHAGNNLFESGYWNNNTNLESTCGTPGEGVYNMDLIQNWYTVETDASGAFSHDFNLNLPAGDYEGIKVLVKKMLDSFVSPWADFTDAYYPEMNLYETQSISFTVL